MYCILHAVYDAVCRLVSMNGNLCVQYCQNDFVKPVITMTYFVLLDLVALEHSEDCSSVV